MSNGRPNLGYSNVYWTRQITRKAIAYAKENYVEEVLEEPIPLPIMTLEDKVAKNNDRIDVSRLSDTFCPPRLTKPSQSDKLYTSPQQGVSNE